MIEHLIIIGLVGISAFFLGRRFLRLLRAVLDKDQPLSCGQGCCSCNSSSDCQNTISPITKEHQEPR